MTKTANFEIQDGGRPPFHFGIVKSPYLSEKSSDFVEIRCTIANFQPEYSHVTKKLKFGTLQQMVNQIAVS